MVCLELVNFPQLGHNLCFDFALLKMHTPAYLQEKRTLELRKNQVLKISAFPFSEQIELCLQQQQVVA